MHVYTSSRDLAVSIVCGGSYQHGQSVSIVTALFLRNQALQPARTWLKIIKCCYKPPEKSAGDNMCGVCNSCNMGTRDLPDVYA